MSDLSTDTSLDKLYYVTAFESGETKNLDYQPKTQRQLISQLNSQLTANRQEIQTTDLDYADQKMHEMTEHGFVILLTIQGVFAKLTAFESRDKKIQNMALCYFSIQVNLTASEVIRDLNYWSKNLYEHSFVISILAKLAAFESRQKIQNMGLCYFSIQVKLTASKVIRDLNYWVRMYVHVYTCRK